MLDVGCSQSSWGGDAPRPQWRRGQDAPRLFLHLRFVWPDRNKLVPLVHILANLRLECTQDLLGQLPAGFAIAQRLAIIGELREHFHGEPGAPANDGYPDQRAARRPRQFRSANRRIEWLAE